MKIKDQKEHVTLLVQCKCIGAVADRDYWIFSSGEVSGVQEHTHIFQHANPLCHSFGKKQVKDIKREKKKRETFS